MDLQRHAFANHEIVEQPSCANRSRWKFDLSFSDLPLAYRLVAKLSVILCVILLAYFVRYLSKPGIAPALADKDFANYWMASHLAASGHIKGIFGPEASYLGYLRTIFGPKMPWHNWSYPPHYLMLLMPLALVSYKVGLVGFITVTGCFFWWAFTSFCEKKSSLPIATAAPFIILNVWLEQNGFLTAALALLALRWRGRRPIAAGICLGLLTIKPQLGFLLPILLLAERRWLVLSSAAVTTCILIAMSALLFGIDAWKDYISIILPYQGLVMTQLTGLFLTMLPSTYGAARLYGISANTSLLIHFIVAVPVSIATIVAIFAARSARTRDYIVLSATFLITPYSLNYDLGLLAAGVTRFIEDGGDQQRRSVQCLLALVMMLPVLMMIVGQFNIALAPPLLLLLFALMVRQAVVWRNPIEWSKNVLTSHRLIWFR